MVRYPQLSIGEIGKSLRVWVRLGRADRPHAKRGTYHVSVFGLWLICGGMVSWWHFHLYGTLGEVFGFEMVLDIFMAQWIKYSFIVILGSLVLYYFYHYCLVFNDFFFFLHKLNGNSQIIAYFVKCSLSGNFHFPHPH